VCRLCVAFQRISGFEAVYAAGALCGVTNPNKRTNLQHNFALRIGHFDV